MPGTGPEAELLRQRLADLPADRRAALDRVLRSRTTSPTALDALAPRDDVSQPTPLSFAQERLWYLENLYQRRDIFAFPTASRLRGRVDLPALRTAVEQIVARHESLRTTFEVVDGAPVQRVHQDWPVDFDVVDLTGNAADCAELASADALTGFDLSASPPLRIRVYRLAGDDHVLVVNQHVAVADVPSRAILLRDLWNRYEHLTTGSAPALPTLPIQYADFAVWQRRRLHGDRLASLLRYWREHLDGAPHKLALSTDRPRPARHEGSGRFLYVDAPAGLGDAVHQTARKLRTTPSVLLLACYRILLWQHTGQSDIVIGSPKSERAHPETENVIGYFVNVLPLRSQVYDTDTVREVIEREHRHALGGYARQELPFERLVQDVNPVREPGVPPLYQVSYSYVSGAAQGLPLAPRGLVGEPFQLRSEGTEYDLGINITHGDELGSQWPYNDDILAEQTVTALAHRFWTVVASVVSDVRAAVGSLPVAAPAESATRLDTGGAQTSSRWDDTVSTTVSATATRTPDATAVHTADAVLTYRQLDARADHIADLLGGHPLDPGSVVTVRTADPVDLPAALLGVWRAGHSWQVSPGDRSSDVDRLPGAGWLLDVNGSAATVSRRHGRPVPATTRGAVTVNAAATTHVPLARLTASATAVGEAVGRVTRLLSTCPRDSLLFAHELVLCLRDGGELVLDPAGPAADQLASQVAACRPSHVVAPAHVWAAVPPGWKAPHPMTAIILGQLPPPAAARLAAMATHVWYGYPSPVAGGPATLRRLSVPLPARVDMGRPLGDVQAMIRRADGRPVPQGAAGELHLRTGPPGTIDFTPTGDYAREGNDGGIEVIGAVDDLRLVRGVPTHGHEIRCLLVESPWVRDAAVVAQQGAEPPFHAYVVPVHDRWNDTGPLLTMLRHRLPPFAVPSMSFLPDLPYTVDGRLDRNALPAPPDRAGALGPRPPHGATELLIADAWATLLGSAPDGADDNFFDLGGHSLMLQALSARLSEAFGGFVPLVELLEHPTIATQALLIQELGLDQPQPSASVVTAGDQP